MQLNRLTAIFLILECSSLEFLPLLFLAQRFPDTCPPDGCSGQVTAYLEPTCAFQYSGYEALELWDRLQCYRSGPGIVYTFASALLYLVGFFLGDATGFLSCLCSARSQVTYTLTFLEVNCKDARSYENAPGPFEAVASPELMLGLWCLVRAPAWCAPGH